MHLVFFASIQRGHGPGSAGHPREGCAAQERGGHETRAWRARGQSGKEEEVSGGPQSLGTRNTWWNLETTKIGMIFHDHS